MKNHPDFLAGFEAAKQDVAANAVPGIPAKQAVAMARAQAGGTDLFWAGYSEYLEVVGGWPGAEKNTACAWIRRRARRIMTAYAFPKGAKAIRVAVAHAYEDWQAFNPS